MLRIGEIGFDIERPVDAMTPQKTVEILAEAHGMSFADMNALWRGAGIDPPTEEARVLKYSASKLLPLELKTRSDLRRNELATKAIEAAWRTTNMVALAKHEPRPRFRDLREKIRSKRLRDFAEKHDPSVDGGALIMGPTGIGKSIACLCVMLRCMRKSVLDAFERSLLVPFTCEAVNVSHELWYSVDAQDLGLAQQHSKLGDPEPECISKARSADRLILDDLGWERGFHVESLIRVAAPRYRLGLASLVTSGEPHQALRERYTDAVLRRFFNVDGQDGVVIDLWNE